MKMMMMTLILTEKYFNYVKDEIQNNFNIEYESKFSTYNVI